MDNWNQPQICSEKQTDFCLYCIHTNVRTENVCVLLTWHVKPTTNLFFNADLWSVSHATSVRYEYPQCAHSCECSIDRNQAEAQEIFPLAEANTAVDTGYTVIMSMESNIPMYTLQGTCCNWVKKQYWMMHGVRMLASVNFKDVTHRWTTWPCSEWHCRTLKQKQNNKF